MLLAFSVFRPCISSHHIVDAYRWCISAMHIGNAYRRIHHQNQNQNQRTNERTNTTNHRPGNARRTDDHPGDDRTRTHPSRRSPDDILTQYQNHPAIDQISPVSASPHCQYATGPPRPDLVPNRPKARLNQDRRF